MVAIEGGYQPCKRGVTPSPGASVEAAIATAAHRVLVYYFPSQQAALDTDYSNFMAAISNGAAKTAGIEVGIEAADGIIALHAGDGVEADIGFTMPTLGPGVWQLPAGVNPLVPWMSKLKPFMLERPNQFRPGPPPDLGSSEWVGQYNEVLVYGHRDSLVRTTEQANVARFWTAAPLLQYNTAFQQIALNRRLNAFEAGDYQCPRLGWHS